MARTTFSGPVNSVAGFEVNGVPLDIADKPQIAALTAIATADASDPTTTQALANECKAKINAIIAALKA